MNGLKFGLAVWCCLSVMFDVHADEQIEQAKVEARTLSQAFRDAARDATPSVVTIYLTAKTYLTNRGSRRMMSKATIMASTVTMAMT